MSLTWKMANSERMGISDTKRGHDTFRSEKPSGKGLDERDISESIEEAARLIGEKGQRAIFGTVAANLYRAELRTAFDLDILLAISKEDLNQIKNAAFIHYRILSHLNRREVHPPSPTTSGTAFPTSPV